MSAARQLIDAAGVHDDWRPLLANALAAVDAGYLAALLDDPDWLPGRERLLAAFRRDRAGLRYLLIGESPYPRRESANGIAFHDAAVGELWSETGLARAVNRATSLRNIVKTALLAEGRLQPDGNGALGQPAIAALNKDGMVGRLDDLFANFERAGFLLLNATPVLHPARKPAREARYWSAFLDRLLTLIADDTRPLPTLVLWGRIAGLVDALPGSAGYPRLCAEHPYNLSFIGNPAMRRLFTELRLLEAR